MATQKPTLFVRNTLARLITLGGVALVPNAVTEIPNDENGVNKRDVESFEGLELVSATSAAEGDGKSSIETRDVLHPDNSQPSVLTNNDANPNPANGWTTPGGLTGDAAATSAANAANASKPAATAAVKDTKTTQAATK
jgi:hypothetical protein